MCDTTSTIKSIIDSLKKNNFIDGSYDNERLFTSVYDDLTSPPETISETTCKCWVWSGKNGVIPHTCNNKCVKGEDFCKKHGSTYGKCKFCNGEHEFYWQILGRYDLGSWRNQECCPEMKRRAYGTKSYKTKETTIVAEKKPKKEKQVKQQDKTQVVVEEELKQQDKTQVVVEKEVKQQDKTQVVVEEEVKQQDKTQVVDNPVVVEKEVKQQDETQVVDNPVVVEEEVKQQDVLQQESINIDITTVDVETKDKPKEKSKDKTKDKPKEKKTKTKEKKQETTKLPINDSFQKMTINESTFYVNTDEEEQEDNYKAYKYIDDNHYGEFIGIYNSDTEIINPHQN